uniref:Uncharacterized protein n=1 Tax=Anguilla anguilla TaxID=7936 RepID=A0A0E9U6F0_ANGAN
MAIFSSTPSSCSQ